MPNKTIGHIMPNKTVTGTVMCVRQAGHTVYGNPIIFVSLSANGGIWGIEYRISDNAALVFEINNPEFRETPHTFFLTKAGRISHRAR